MSLKADREAVNDLPDNVVRTLETMAESGEWLQDVGYDELPELSDDKDFTKMLQDSKHVKHEGLIDMAHRDGLALTYTEPIQIPPPDKVKEGHPVICRAVVATRRGVFTGIGDATPGDTMVDAYIRMAETRALSRALRAAVNVGEATAPEMPDSSDGVVVED